MDRQQLCQEFRRWRVVHGLYRKGADTSYRLVVSHHPVPHADRSLPGRLSVKYGLAQLTPENMVDGLGWFVMRKKQFRKAEELFTLNVKNYPESSTARESLRQLYAAMGKQEGN